MIAVSNALAAAFTSYLEFKRVDTNVVACNMSAADLYDIRVWWHSLSPEARKLQTNVEILVSSTEAVLQTENSGWLQEMREALSEIYGEKKDSKSEIHPAQNGRSPSDDSLDPSKLEPHPVIVKVPLDNTEAPTQSELKAEGGHGDTETRGEGEGIEGDEVIR